MDGHARLPRCDSCVSCHLVSINVMSCLVTRSIVVVCRGSFNADMFQYCALHRLKTHCNRCSNQLARELLPTSAFAQLPMLSSRLLQHCVVSQHWDRNLTASLRKPMKDATNVQGLALLKQIQLKIRFSWLPLSMRLWYIAINCKVPGGAGYLDSQAIKLLCCNDLATKPGRVSQRKGQI